MSKPRSNWQDVHGIILLNKPKDITSNTALQKVRRLLNAKKAGHTGSLDPMATGLLPCCFGDATKVAGLMLNSDKTYIAECQVGNQTDSGDATGKVTQTNTKTILSQDEIQQAVKQLTGTIQQIPPMYSALHHKGKRLYDLARQGLEVEREPRSVTIHSFTVLEIENNNPQNISFEIKVSKGTYIRTLLEDFAKACGTYAHMTKLHRIELGVLNNNMLTLEQLEKNKTPHSLLQDIDIALTEYKKIQLNQEQIKTLVHGLLFETKLEPNIYRLYDFNNKFLGLGEALDNNIFKVKKLFLKSYQA